MQQNRAVPAPIFNARKRPRQAVIAEPLMTATGPGGTRPGPGGDAPYQGLMPPGGFSGSGRPPHHMSGTGDAGNLTNQGRTNYRETTNSGRQWNGNRAESNYNNNNNMPGNRNNQASTGPARFQSGQQYPPPAQAASNSYNNSYHNSNNNSGRPCPGGQASSGGPYNNNRSGQAQARTYSFNNSKQPARGNQPPHQGTGGGPRGGAQGYGGLPGTSGGNNNQESSGYGNGGGSTNSYPVGGYTAGHAANMGGQYMPSFVNTAGDFEDELNDSMGPVPTQMLSNNSNTAIGSTKKEPTPVKKKHSGVTVTAQLLTVRAAGLKRWAKYKDSLQLIFEVFGYLDSALGRMQEGCRDFLLRDDVKEPINCVFYEIDRPLAKMTRGQWYRVVGTYDQRGDHLKCVSVRAVGEQERPLIQTLVDRSSQELAKLTRQNREQ